jgi:hypothetical protein
MCSEAGLEALDLATLLASTKIEGLLQQQKKIPLQKKSATCFCFFSE